MISLCTVEKFLISLVSFYFLVSLTWNEITNIHIILLPKSFYNRQIKNRKIPFHDEYIRHKRWRGWDTENQAKTVISYTERFGRFETSHAIICYGEKMFEVKPAWFGEETNIDDPSSFLRNRESFGDHKP